MEKTIGTEAAETLYRAVSMKWFDAAPRVHNWMPVLAQAYDAVAAGDPQAVVHVPSHIADMGSKDVPAYELLKEFNHWLGRNVVFDCLDFVTGWDEEL